MIYPNDFEQKIGFNQIRLSLKDQCLSTLGKERVDNMLFNTQHEVVNEKLNQVCELVQILQEEDEFPSQHYFDLRPALRRIKVVGLFLSEQELFDLRRSLETINAIVKFLRTEHEDNEENEASATETAASPYPCLRRLAGDINVFPRTIARIDNILNQFGQVKDNASPELARIRREQQQTIGSISRLLNGILRSAQSEGVVEKEAQPTLRDGRLVIPVAPAMKRRIKGIVHDESASGKTIFIEPAEVVEANNRIRELKNEEKHEIARILLEFTDELRPSIPDILNSYSFLADIDFIRAKALWAIHNHALKPQLEKNPVIDWGSAVHPLLQDSLHKHGKKMVPLDIELTREKRILLISGPNAGGKSVCLKTVGLLQYMLQNGMLIPVHEGSHAGIFEDLFIDIGDEQSIENDLSTYSSHLLNMKNMMKHCNEHSLILIDEFGGGTDPQMGGAIAEAVLRRFNQSGTFGIITTHYQNLKHFAEDHEGVVNGAMLYDRNLMQPLFILQIGMPGSSFAVEIARKIGLPADVIADASEIVGSDYINSDKYIQDIIRDRRYWQNKRQNIHQREKALEETIARYQQEMEQLVKDRKEIMAKAKAEASDLVKEANAKIENTIKTIKEKQAEREQTKQARQELTEFKQRLEGVSEADTEDQIERKMAKLKERQQRRQERKQQRNANGNEGNTKDVKQQPPKVHKPIAIGDHVRIKGQQTVGQVMELQDKQAIVAFGNLRTTIAVERLQHTENSNRANELSTKSTYISEQTQDAVYEKKLNFKQDIDVRGMRGQEAINAVAYFIDDAILLNIHRVRILHGTGTGILRQLIRQYLATVPGVSKFGDEHVQFGGAGITVVDLE